MKDGDTIVISGLSKKKTQGKETGVPWLRDIPLLGYLFKGEAKNKTMEEVLIFITPHILKTEAETIKESEGKVAQGKEKS